MLDEKSRQKIIERLASYWALKYREGGRGAGSSEPYIKDARMGIAFLLRDSFARSGGEQAGYGEIAINALDLCIKDAGSYNNFIVSPTAYDEAWTHFVQICKMKFQYIHHKKGFGENERLNKTVVQGIVKLAQASNHFNPFEELCSKLPADTVAAFFLLRNIKGIGDKIAAFLLRDIVSMTGLDDEIQRQDQILLQPVDRWVNGISAYIWNNPDRAPAWFVASRIISECEKYGYSPIKFNQGAWKYGTDVITNTNSITKVMSSDLQWK